MLEIRNLSKVYHSKTGESVRALDNVSITFPESGMVFILGKSGSGKSTLLNIMGGLDSYDSGEFVIKGKSSKNFAGSDFDAYRNTFIGFIFQEYNVLDDFTVGANIALALELQGKKATAEQVNGILSQVDLLNFAKRKPNELSGGQKQRVAIARALVKEPQIIMADEPTGALDSNTGKQIFDTLKNLSKEKLVLVVSHDRDFAERYADRIIELADGRIISDVTKHEHESEKLTAGIDKIGGHILKIKGGYRLTHEDLEMINAYLAEHKEDVLLSGDGRVNEELRSAAGISERGTTAVFEGTDAAKDYTLKQYEKADSKFIRSRLPLKNALRMGASGLKHKKFRLVMTILLSLIAFAMFGIADTMAGYDKIVATTESVRDSNVKNASVTVGVRHTTTYQDEEPYVSFYNANLNDEDISYLREKTGLNFVPVFTGSMDSGFYGGMSVTSQMPSYQNNEIYTGKLHGLVDMSAEELAAADFVIKGRMPEKAGEIAITEVMYRQFNEFGFQNKEFDESIPAGAVTLDGNTKNSIIGKHITISDGINIINGKGFSFEIVGVIDTQFNYDRYEVYLPKDQEGGIQQEDENVLTDMVLQMELRSEMAYGFHGLGFVKNEDIETIWKSSYMMDQSLSTYMHGWNSSLYIAVNRPESDDDKGMVMKENISEIADSSVLSKLKITWFDGINRTALSGNEAVIPSRMLEQLIPREMKITVDSDQVRAEAERLYPGQWDRTDPGMSYMDRFRQAAQWHYWSIYIDSQLQRAEVVESVRQFAEQNTGDSLGTVEELKSYWLRHWMEADSQAPVNVGELGVLSAYEIEVPLDRDLFPFALSLMGITDPPQDVQSILDSHYLYEILNGTNEESGEYLLRIDQIEMVLREIYAECDVIRERLWENDKFVDQMLTQQTYLAEEWESMPEIRQIDEAKNFYSGIYLSWSEYGYEENAYGEYAGKELAERARDIFKKKSGFDEQSLLSSMSFEWFESNYETMNETSLGLCDMKIVGTYDSNAYTYSSMIISDALMARYETWAEESNAEFGYHEEIAEHENGPWSFALAPIGADREVIRMLVEMSYDETGDLQFRMQNSVMDTLDAFNEFIEIGALIFLYIGIGFAVFSALLLMNFIATSISYKKREIGILRAVGARSSDVFKIFFSEALIIALINFLLSTAAVVATIIITNTMMRNSGINVTLLSYGPRQFILMLLVSVGVALLASFLPVYNIARRKPVDAIKDR